MSQKNVDNYNRFRGITVAFRVSPEESERINMLVNTSGMTKQDYIIARLENREINVYPNIRVLSYLRDNLERLGARLEMIAAEERGEVLEDIRYLLEMIYRMKE